MFPSHICSSSSAEGPRAIFLSQAVTPATPPLLHLSISLICCQMKWSDRVERGKRNEQMLRQMGEQRELYEGEKHMTKITGTLL